MLIDSATASAEMPSEIRVPPITRDKRSRLNWSVPKMCFHDGGALWSVVMPSCAFGEYGVRWSPPIATTMRIAMTTSDHCAARSASNRRRNDVVAISASFRGLADARVDRPLQYVGQQIANDDHHSGDDDGCRDDVVVAPGDRVRG